MSVENLCNEIQDDMEVIVAVTSSRLDRVLVTHADFSLEIEVTDTQVLIHDIKVFPTHRGIGTALATIICNWAHDEEVGVVALNVLPDAEDWWVSQGFYRKNEDNDLYYLSAELEDANDEDLSDTY